MKRSSENKIFRFILVLFLVFVGGVVFITYSQEKACEKEHSTVYRTVEKYDIAHVKEGYYDLCYVHSKDGSRLGFNSYSEDGSTQYIEVLIERTTDGKEIPVKIYEDEKNYRVQKIEKVNVYQWYGMDMENIASTYWEVYVPKGEIKNEYL